MRMLPCSLLLFVSLAACGAPDDEEPVASAPSLDGAYRAESGPYSWTSFYGDAYLSIRSDAACNVDAPPDACIERGHFTLDVASGILRLTSDSGVVRTPSIEIREVKPRSEAGTLIQSVELVKGEKQLLSPNVVTSFKLVDKSEQLVQEADLRKFLIICRVIGLALNPPTQPVIVPVTPPPIVQQQQCAGASSKG